ncbi:MAG: O-antigen ligase family protein [Bacilli bacterium]
MEEARIGTFFGDQNLLGYIFAYGLLALLDFSLRKKYYLLIIPALYSLFLIFLTGSRSALIICFLCILIYIYLLFRKKNNWVVISSILVSVFLLVLALSLPYFESFRNRIIGSLSQIFLGSGGDDSTILRLQYVYDGIEFSIRRISFGYGSIDASLIVSRSGQSMHNNFLDMALNYGIIFVFIFEAFLIYLWYGIRKSKDGYNKIFTTLLVAIFLVQFFFPNYWTKPEYLFYPFIVSIISSGGPFFEITLLKGRFSFEYFNKGSQHRQEIIRLEI